MVFPRYTFCKIDKPMDDIKVNEYMIDIRVNKYMII